MVGVHVGQLDVYQQQHLISDGAQEVDLRLLNLVSAGQYQVGVYPPLHQSGLCTITWSLVRLSLSLICWVTILSISSLSMGY